ncbi:hypothetical protein [Agriterribacter humi]|jgi:hypothetical protein|uniref:hypothetical protein n=1 Tax=Agriterribacter humi TaxID=1104781 RepID=UPI001264F7A5|nr:hypothetical protein [Agriterribacter humi]
MAKAFYKKHTALHMFSKIISFWLLVFVVATGPGPGYIVTKISYAQGSYETSGIVSGVAPETEAIIMDAIRKVLK